MLVAAIIAPLLPLAYAMDWDESLRRGVKVCINVLSCSSTSSMLSSMLSVIALHQCSKKAPSGTRTRLRSGLAAGSLSQPSANVVQKKWRLWRRCAGSCTGTMRPIPGGSHYSSISEQKDCFVEVVLRLFRPVQCLCRSTLAKVQGKVPQFELHDISKVISVLPKR